MGRIHEVTLEDNVARQILAANLAASFDFNSMCMYPKVKWRSRGPWEALYKNRGILGDLFRASGGHLLHQVSLSRQISAYLTNIPIAHSPDDAENVSIRIRKQMSHLRDHKKQTRAPPPRFQPLCAIMDIIDSSGKPACASEKKAMPDSMPAASTALAFPPFLAKSDSVEVVPLHDAEQREPGQIDISDEGESVDEDNIFVTPEKKIATHSAETPTPVSLAPAVRTMVPFDVTNDEIDKMLADEGEVGPTRAAYRALKRPAASASGCSKRPACSKFSASLMKRPAAAEEIVEAAPVKAAPVKADPAERKRIYSRGYHSTRAQMSAEGGSTESDIIAAAKAAGRAAVLRAFGS